MGAGERSRIGDPGEVKFAPFGSQLTVPQRETDYLRKAPVLLTSTPPSSSSTEGNAKAERSATESYVVQPGDMLTAIAERHGVTTATLVWANDLLAPDNLQVGAVLKVPPGTGVLHKVTPNESLGVLAERYNVSSSVITGHAANGLTDPDALVVGQELFIPGATKKTATPSPGQLAGVSLASGDKQSAVSLPPPASPHSLSQGALQWPTSGPVFTYFEGGHKGLDISPPYGTSVVAAASGTVVAAGYTNDGYGNNVMISHDGGYQTRYAHLSTILVGVGQRIDAGELVGRVGASGRVTGAHLHFEVYEGSSLRNPLSLLP